MRALVLAVALALAGCSGSSNVVNAQPENPPNPGVFYLNGDPNADWLVLWNTGKVQVLNKINEQFPHRVSHPSCSGQGPWDNITIDYAVLVEGYLSGGYMVSGKLKSLWTDPNTPGYYDTYWPVDANGVANDVSGVWDSTTLHFDVAHPFVAEWTGEVWEVSITGAPVEDVCGYRTASGAGHIGTYSQ